MMLGYSGNKADYIYNSIYNFSATHLSRGRVNLDGQLTFGFDNKKYPPGSWEWAAVSVFFDAHYQYGKMILSYQIVCILIFMHDDI